MGDPKRQRKKYATPPHPWNKERLDEEKELVREYGLKNKKEIWRMKSFLESLKAQAKTLTADHSGQSEKEAERFFARLKRLGLFTGEDVSQDDVLSLGIRSILERRLQSLVVRKGLARSMSQSRQFITHRHIEVGGKKITSPSYLVKKEEEDNLIFSVSSNLSDENHPERKLPEKTPEDVETEARAKDEEKQKEKEVTKTEDVKEAKKEAESDKVETPEKVESEDTSEKKE